jgi:hypothetical protein
MTTVVPSVPYADLLRAYKAVSTNKAAILEQAILADLTSDDMPLDRDLYTALCYRLQALRELHAAQIDAWKALGLTDNALLHAAASVRLDDSAITNPIMDNTLRFDPDVFLAAAKKFKE